jgi:hypothetical protein
MVVSREQEKAFYHLAERLLAPPHPPHVFVEFYHVACAKPENENNHTILHEKEEF